MRPYGLMADLHLHNWQAFSSVQEDGINTRLAALHDEIDRCCEELHKVGGNRIYIAGDAFHVRGSIAPSVLNPTLDVIGLRIKAGFEFVILPGNHDLEGKHTTRIGSAVTALEGVGCRISSETLTYATVADQQKVITVPWHENLTTLKAELEALAKSMPGYDVLIHAPIDGTLTGIPARGISPDYLSSLGFKRVFAGHYHNHKDFGNGIYSIGALSHHSWSDVGSKAGFLVVSEHEVKWFKAHTPEFVDLSAANDDTEAEIMAEGNFVRARLNGGGLKEIAQLKEWMTKSGAKGVVVQVIKKPTKSREGAVVHTVRAGASIEASISAYIKSQEFPNAEELQIECQKVLAEVEV